MEGILLLFEVCPITVTISMFGVMMISLVLDRHLCLVVDNSDPPTEYQTKRESDCLN